MQGFFKTEGGFVVDKPGHVLFVPVKADGSLDYVNAIRNTAIINTINVTNSKTKTDIQNGNAFYPAGDRVTAITGTVAVEFSTIDPEIWAMCSGSEAVVTENDTMVKLYESQTIGEDGTLKLTEKYKANGFVQILGADGTVYEKVDAEPKTGEFKIEAVETGTTITFAAEDKDKAVKVSMEVLVTTVSYTEGQQTMKNHKIIIDTQYSTLNDTEKIPVNIEISQVSVTGDTVLALQKDPSATKTLTFSMYAPRPGEKPYKIKMADVTAK